MGWPGHLRIDYRRTHGPDGPGTTALDRHSGPLRVLQRLYPEGPQVCHHVLVHPPGGLVGGDTLGIELHLAAGTHALLTTPGAARFYRSDGPAAAQRLKAQLADGARLEWLPMESLAYSGCRAENALHFDLAPGAEMMGWDVLALGLPAAGQGFERGQVLQEMSLAGHWLERGRIDAQDVRLRTSPLGLAGRSVIGTLWFGAGHALDEARRERLLEAARACLPPPGKEAPVLAGVTSPQPQVLVCRALGHRVEPVAALLRAVWAGWREAAWGLAAASPRLWRT
jgi:urease accessory protein